MTYGAPAAPGAEAPGDRPVSASVVETFGELEAEYASLRKGCVLLDLPQRGTIRVSGADRLDFLNRMVTNELKGLRPFQSRHAFWLNRKGRIDADLRLVEYPEFMEMNVDVLAAAGAARTLSSFVFSEAVEFADESETTHRLALHGPTALRLLAAVSTHEAGPPLSDFMPGHAAMLRIAGRPVRVDRWDSTGEVGLELVMHVQDVQAVYEQFLERGLDANGHSSGEPIRLRPAGWHAYNIARIEAGTPLFNIDFGSNSLPAETGVLAERVSFTKGCYLGQEVVARMQALGHPKQVLVGLRVRPTAEQAASGLECQPISGAALLDEQATPVGAVTSSTRSPMLGDAIIGFGQVKWDARQAGTVLLADCDAGRVPTTVQPTLTHWSRAT